MRSSLAPAVCLVLLLAAPSRAATVYLKDGSRIQGTVVGATARDVQVYTPDGTLRISTDRIRSIDYEGQAPPAGAAPPAAPPVYEPQRAPVHSRFAVGEGEPAPGPEEFSIDLGITGPLSEVNWNSFGHGAAGNGDVGVAIGAQYLHWLSGRLALGADLEWLRRGATDSFGLINNADANVSGGSLVFLGVMKYGLLDRGDARPYVELGAGLHRTSEIVDATPRPGFVWNDTQTGETRRLVDDHASGAAGTIRLGVDFHVFEPSIFSLEAGWTALSGANYRATPAGQAIGVGGVSGPLHLLTVVGRWGWRF